LPMAIVPEVAKLPIGSIAAISARRAIGAAKSKATPNAIPAM
jgi:hypothetical protein